MTWAPAPPAAGALGAAVGLAARHRRLAAALLLGAAVTVALSALASHPAPAAPAAAGASLELPSGIGDSPIAGAGRVAVEVRLADPAALLLLRVGSHAQLLAGPGSDGGLPGSVAASSAGASGPDAGGAASAQAEILARDAVVLAVPGQPGRAAAPDTAGSASGLLGATSAAGGGGGGAMGGLDGVLVVAVPSADARRIAAVAGVRPLSVAVALP